MLSATKAVRGGGSRLGILPDAAHYRTKHTAEAQQSLCCLLKLLLASWRTCSAGTLCGRAGKAAPAAAA